MFFHFPENFGAGFVYYLSYFETNSYIHIKSHKWLHSGYHKTYIYSTQKQQKQVLRTGQNPEKNDGIPTENHSPWQTEEPSAHQKY